MTPIWNEEISPRLRIGHVTWAGTVSRTRFITTCDKNNEHKIYQLRKLSQSERESAGEQLCESEFDYELETTCNDKVIYLIKNNSNNDYFSCFRLTGPLLFGREK